MQRPTFQSNTAFHQELTSRAQIYFSQAQLDSRDARSLYLKSFVILTWVGLSYGFLIWGNPEPILRAILIILLGLGMAAVGFNIMHDGGHGAFSRIPWINRLAAGTLDLLGASSHLWHWKHNILHHSYVNVSPFDTDLETGGIARLSPPQSTNGHHRFQHLYLWVLYLISPIRWQLLTDFVELRTRKIAGISIPSPKKWSTTWFWIGKAIFLSLAFFIPMTFHAPGWVLVGYFAVMAVMSFTITAVFQVAHCNGEVTHYSASAGGCWAKHQVETTANFRMFPALNWFVGGLNYQIEHHLFPRVSHVHYPALAKIVEGCCARHGVRYHTYPSFGTALKAHHQWIRFMGGGAVVGQR